MFSELYRLQQNVLRIQREQIILLEEKMILKKLKSNSEEIKRALIKNKFELKQKINEVV